jgi:glyoxylase-like metal-dependent hydrolase (beta-lactamase superfamily II)
VLHLPHAHTDGDSVVWFTGSRVVHLGDLMFNRRLPFVDLQSGGSVEGMLRNVERVLEWTAGAEPGLRFIPGHGELASRAELERYRQLLQVSLELVRRRLGEGMGLEAIKQAGLPEPWASWSWEFIDVPTWLEIVTRSVVAPPD